MYWLSGVSTVENIVVYFIVLLLFIYFMHMRILCSWNFCAIDFFLVVLSRALDCSTVVVFSDFCLILDSTSWAEVAGSEGYKAGGFGAGWCVLSSCGAARQGVGIGFRLSGIVVVRCSTVELCSGLICAALCACGSIIFINLHERATTLRNKAGVWV